MPAMDAIKNLLSLRSTREFDDRPVPDEVVSDILEVARWTGSSRNSQPWQFVAIRDRATLRQLAEIVPYGKHLAGAALGVVIVMEGEGRGASLDAGRAAERVLLSAHAHGVGSCITTIPNEELERQALELLGVPAGHSLRVAIALGYPRPLTAEEKEARRNRPNRGRKPLAEIAHYDRFGQRTPGG